MKNQRAWRLICVLKEETETTSAVAVLHSQTKVRCLYAKEVDRKNVNNRCGAFRLKYGVCVPKKLTETTSAIAVLHSDTVRCLCIKEVERNNVSSRYDALRD